MIVTIILTICVFVSWLLIPHKVTRYILGSISTLLLLLTIIGIKANMTHHFGMEKQVITSKETEIYSAGAKNSPINMLIANEVGKNTNNYVMVFKDQENDKKAQPHFKPKMDKENISETVKHQANYVIKDTNKATKQTKKEVWVWKSKFYKFLFNFGQGDKEIIKRTTTISVPKDTWVVLNAEQSKKLQHSSNTQNKKVNPKKQQAKMQNLMAKYKKQHPDASQQEIKKYIKHQQQIQATKQIKNEISK